MASGCVAQTLRKPDLALTSRLAGLRRRQALSIGFLSCAMLMKSTVRFETWPHLHGHAQCLPTTGNMLIRVEALLESLTEAGSSVDLPTKQAFKDLRNKTLKQEQQVFVTKKGGESSQTVKGPPFVLGVYLQMPNEVVTIYRILRIPMS